MRSLIIFVCFISWAEAQVNRPARQSHNGHGWDIRLAVPGEPGSDYPTLGSIPRTSFSCAGKQPGYYADLETNCQVFRVCTAGSTYGFQSFLCPNGTLFNQAVFVCDWWMNVHCERSQDLFINNNDKFGNLKLGPQLMKDIKKMLTHPMRNPYDKSVMKSNLIVMQDYKPPFGQMFPNGALIAGFDRKPNSLYVPVKQVQSYDQNVFSDNVFAASTPSSQYIPPYNTATLQRDAEIFQRQQESGYNAQNGRLQQSQQTENNQYTQTSQTQNHQYMQNGRLQNLPQSGYSQYTQLNRQQINNGQYLQSGRLQNSQPNGHAGQFSHTDSSTYSNNNGNSILRPTQTYNQVPYNQNPNYESTKPFNSRGQTDRQNAQYTDSRTSHKSNTGNQRDFSAAKPSYNYNANQDDNSRHFNSEDKQNLVSNNDIPATIITKTLTVNKIQDPKPGQPKSRITFKTWIVKPSKAAKLVAKPTPYTYDRPTLPSAQKIIDDSNAYVYNTPTSIPQNERIVSEPGYIYNKPTMAAKQVLTTSKLPPRLYLPPTAAPPTLARVQLTVATTAPTVPSRLYIPPTTYKPANLYIPPSQSNLLLSRQYLVPNAILQPSYSQNEKLRASPTTPTLVYTTQPNVNNNNPSFSLLKQSRINTNHNNLTFADILTKEKLDITVNDIVSDTNKILKTASPQYQQYQQEKSVDYPEENYLPPDHDHSAEKLTSQSPTVPTSAKYISDPSRDLEPPVESYSNNQNNPLSSLPFFKEPATNTIERTVSLKISIPEKIAAYLFKHHNESNYDKLEILNTGSSNYLVLTNNLAPKPVGGSFIPLGRLIEDKNTNISNSQALAFSFLADSLNAAKEYNNLAQQNVLSTTPSQQYQNVNDEDLSQITNKISQLTASQYSANNHNFNQPNVASTAQSDKNVVNQYKPAKYTNYPQNQKTQISSTASQTSQPHISWQQGNELNANLKNSHVYSGQLYQLPVPDVTSQIYNAEAPKLVKPNTPQHTEAAHLNEVNQNNNEESEKHSNEILQSQTLPLPPAKLQLAPNEAEPFNSQEQSAQALNFLNNGNGIAAQIRDKIVGTLQHPLEENKLVSYKKDESYYVYTKLDNNLDNEQGNIIQTHGQNAKLIQRLNTPNLVSFQFVPSVSYQLTDQDQQNIPNGFNINPYSNSKKGNLIQNNQDVTSNIDYSVNHPTSAKQINGQNNNLNTLYAGPSSYSAPQASVGSLEVRDGNLNNNLNSRLEEFNDSRNGYGKRIPDRQFSF